ncbi:hypothetical protein [Noviherbaspirillum saxi]|uniref:HTH cro/C1-type domain-containing protein n=1 Tax=Noviherbaspirillum saxi TaxID=2320863 RepID=A0A3A3FUP4_9BURK|nr:hypothetical protein [Noviherbaspirillum saxi]RJF99034.1 hypothetical protein D3871_11320 [Noviherbaspirillum saxi]
MQKSIATVKPLTEDHLSIPTYDPNNLLDDLIEKLNLKNDAALSRALEIAPPVISKIRHRRLPIGASLLVRMHDMTGLQLNELRKMAGIPLPTGQVQASRS